MADLNVKKNILSVTNLLFVEMKVDERSLRQWIDLVLTIIPYSRALSNYRIKYLPNGFVMFAIIQDRLRHRGIKRELERGSNR